MTKKQFLVLIEEVVQDAMDPKVPQFDVAVGWAEIAFKAGAAGLSWKFVYDTLLELKGRSGSTKCGA
jgi:hypothetical protein